ncbi:MAG: MFS transporter [Janthinobacterium lividum]
MTGWLLADSRFRPLFICQFLSAFGDNLLRNALGVLVLWSAGTDGKHQEWMVAAAAGTFVAPSILLSGLGGELADKMDKARLIRALKFADLMVACIAAAGLAVGQLNVVFAALVGSGAVAALFGPVKYGILPDQFGKDRLGAANALVEGATFAAILGGSVGANLLAGRDRGATLIAAVVVAVAMLSWISACGVSTTVPAAPLLVARANLLVSTRDLLLALRRDRRSWRAALASTWFWMVGAAVLSLLPGLVHDVLGGSARENGAFLALFALGVACGSALASYLNGERIILVTAAIGCAMAGASLLEVWHLTWTGAVQSWPLFLALLVTATGAGMLAVPAQAAVQAWAAPERRARAVGGMNVLAALGMVLTSVLLVAAQKLGIGEPALLGVVGLVCVLLAPLLLLTLPTDPADELAWIMARLFR